MAFRFTIRSLLHSSLVDTPSTRLFFGLAWLAVAHLHPILKDSIVSSQVLMTSYVSSCQPQHHQQLSGLGAALSSDLF